MYRCKKPEVLVRRVLSFLLIFGLLAGCPAPKPPPDNTETGGGNGGGQEAVGGGDASTGGGSGGGTGGGASNTGGGGGGTMKPSLHYSKPEMVCTKGVAVEPNVPSYGAEKATSFSINPAAPAGMSFDAQTGILSGAPTAVTAKATYRVTAKGDWGEVTGQVVIEVRDVAPTELHYSEEKAVYVKGKAITPNTPRSTGGAIVSFTSAKPLPEGLRLDPSTGIISGTPSAPTPATSFIIEAQNSGGSTSRAISIQVNDAAPTGLRYKVGSIVLTKDVYMEPLYLDFAAAGGTPTSYTISPALPKGLYFSLSRGAIDGIPEVFSARQTYTVTASNMTGSASTSIAIAVNEIDGNADFLTRPFYQLSNEPRTAGASWSVVISGTYAYAITDHGFMVFDISTPNTPRFVTHFIPTPEIDSRGIVAAGNRVYLNARYSILIVDVSSPSTPKTLGVYDPDDQVDALKVVGQVAYFTTSLNRDQLRAVDVSDPTSVRLLGTIEIDYSHEFINVIRNNVIAVSTTYTSRFVDVSDPAHMKVLSTFTDTNRMRAAVLFGNYLYVSTVESYARNQKVHIIDVSDVTAAKRVGAIELPGDVSDIAISDKTLLVTNEDRVVAFDLSTPTAPRQIGSHSTRYRVQRIVMAGAYAYVGSWYFGPTSPVMLQAIDMSKPSMPSEVAAVAMEGGAVRLVVADNLTYTIGSNGLFIFDTSNQSSPQMLSNLRGFIYPLRSIALAGDVALLGEENRLEIMNIKDPRKPSRVSSRVYSVADSIALSDDKKTAYFADSYIGYTKLVVLDISNPSSPVETGTYQASKWRGEVTRVGDHVFMMASTGVDQVYIGSKTPVLRAHFSTLGQPTSMIAVGQNDVFANQDELYILENDSLSMLSHPKTLKKPNRLAQESGKVYVAEASAIEVFDFDNAARPKFLGRFDAIANVQDLTVKNGFVYYVSGLGGLHIMDASPKITIDNSQQTVAKKAKTSFVFHWANPGTAQVPRFVCETPVGVCQARITDLQSRTGVLEWTATDARGVFEVALAVVTDHYESVARASVTVQ